MQHTYHITTIDNTDAWNGLISHEKNIISSLHLKDLLLDHSRSKSMIVSHQDIIFDYSRQVFIFIFLFIRDLKLHVY